MAEVSVIVPVYNAEKTLSRSVESVLAQTELDWELWLVNDGSSDGSLALCREYEAADPRIHVIDKPNGGVGSARNAGLDAAAGEYVAFLDSDDAYEPNFLKTLLTLAKRESAPVVCGSVREVYPEKKRRGESRYSQSRGVPHAGRHSAQLLSGRSQLAVRLLEQAVPPGSDWRYALFGAGNRRGRAVLR